MFSLALYIENVADSITVLAWFSCYLWVFIRWGW